MMNNPDPDRVLPEYMTQELYDEIQEEIYRTVAHVIDAQGLKHNELHRHQCLVAMLNYMDLVKSELARLQFGYVLEIEILRTRLRIAELANLN